jgi:Ni/Co efflux regulator RcnB
VTHRDSRDHNARHSDREPPRSSWNTGRTHRDPGAYTGWRDDRGRDWRHRREWYDQYRADRWRYDRGRWYSRTRFSVGIYLFPRGHSVRLWQRGQWLPSAYYVERRWHLGDYWRYGLYDPPYAAGWVRVGDDALLVDLRTGEVLDVVFELFW